jgi:hypothetical protein
LESFEYVMVLVSIVIGLALTHVLSALGAAVHRFRGHGSPIHLEAVYLLWVGFTLLWVVSFWWWEFKFQDVALEWSYGLYLFVICYAISLFLLCVILVPHRMSGVVDSYEYFMAGRRWFFGFLISVQALDFVDTFLKGADWGLRPVYLVQAGVYLAACVIGILSERRSVQLAGAAAAFVVNFVYAFIELGILGSF